MSLFSDDEIQSEFYLRPSGDHAYTLVAILYLKDLLSQRIRFEQIRLL